MDEQANGNRCSVSLLRKYAYYVSLHREYFLQKAYQIRDVFKIIYLLM